MTTIKVEAGKTIKARERAATFLKLEMEKARGKVNETIKAGEIRL